ncbi:MAG: chorismate-binding protein [Candidatus Omnitrophica bacterium]|nr:chorismate-binding protein [Candidatus Omnitrophota bacterium]
MTIFFQFAGKPFLFQNPAAVISGWEPRQIPAVFAAVESKLSQGYFAAGFFSFEAGYVFEKNLAGICRQPNFPLIQIGFYKKPVLNAGPRRGRQNNFSLTGLRLNISQAEYFSKIAQIREYIAAGDVYQITYCLKLLFSFRGDPLALYSRLLHDQPVPYPAYLISDGFSILSLSPELFVKKTGQRVITKPMKGTWPRGPNSFADWREYFRFQHDPKNRAENVMIADLLRNDLGKIGRRIQTPRLFEIGKYQTLFQMTSTVTGQVDPAVSLYSLFQALFPSGSVTGAPKIRAMEIIRALEPEERKIYTGGLGYITPDKDIFFNIPIRTILLQNGNGEMGIGGGIVWDSTPQGEWEEGLLKAKFLTNLSDMAMDTLPAGE